MIQCYQDKTNHQGKLTHVSDEISRKIVVRVHGMAKVKEEQYDQW